MNNPAREERLVRLNALADDFLKQHKWDEKTISEVNTAIAKIAIPYDYKQLTHDLWLIVARGSGRGNRKYQLMLRDSNGTLSVEEATLPEKAMIMAALDSFIESYMDYVKIQTNRLSHIKQIPEEE